MELHLIIKMMALLFEVSRNWAWQRKFKRICEMKKRQYKTDGINNYSRNWPESILENTWSKKKRKKNICQVVNFE